MDNKVECKINFNKAPKKGLVLAYFRDGIVFKPYDLEQFDGENDIILGHHKEELLELHMFDEEQEFRAVYSLSRNQYIPNDIVSESSEDVIEEKVLLLEGEVTDKIIVRNYLDYDDYGMVKVCGYQLRKEKVK